jgi:hypothetical protein
MADPILYYKAIIYKDAVHRPLGTNERLSGDSIPISAFNGNQIKLLSDGLYVGPYAGKTVYYLDAVNGIDAPNNGDKATPLQTLDYVMQLISDLNGGYFESTVVVALKAGQTFTYSKVMNMAGDMTITFWGDPKYGDFDNPRVVGLMATWVPVDLQRPIINIQLDPTSGGGIACWVFNPPRSGRVPRMTFSGVRFNLPTGNYQSGQGAILVANQKTNVSLVLEGTIINANGDNSTYGLISVLPSAVAYLYQFASQLRVDNILIGANPTPPPTLIQLQRRKWFIKMHPDFYPTEQTGYDPLMQHASPGSGLMNLSWTDTFTATDANNNTAQATWPTLADQNFGFGNYVNILNRDNQGRPLNIISGRLF